jgi:hypothetical protein
LSFFVHPVYTLEELRSHSFFLRYNGSGLTKQDIDEMSTQDRVWEVTRLVRQLKDEREAQEKVIAKSKAQGQALRNRAWVPRASRR